MKISKFVLQTINIFEKGFSVQNSHGRELNIFLQKFKIFSFYHDFSKLLQNDKNDIPVTKFS